MPTPTERRLEALLGAERAVYGNWALRGGLAIGALRLVDAMAPDGNWRRVALGQVAEASCLSSTHIWLLLHALEGDGLLELRGHVWSTPRRVRPWCTHVEVRSLVGQRLAVLRALAVWDPDWSAYRRHQAPRPGRVRGIHADPD